MADFESVKPRFCSSILVNALLSMGCCLSSRLPARADPKGTSTSGDHFFDETLRLIELEGTQYSLTTIPALGIMSVREAKCGRSPQSYYYATQSMRLAFEMGLHRETTAVDQDQRDVESATFWGAFSLDQ